MAGRPAASLALMIPCVGFPPSRSWHRGGCRYRMYGSPRCKAHMKQSACVAVGIRERERDAASFNSRLCANRVAVIPKIIISRENASIANERPPTRPPWRDAHTNRVQQMGQLGKRAAEQMRFRRERIAEFIISRPAMGHRPDRRLEPCIHPSIKRRMPPACRQTCGGSRHERGRKDSQSDSAWSKSAWARCTGRCVRVCTAAGGVHFRVRVGGTMGRDAPRVRPTSEMLSGSGARAVRSWGQRPGGRNARGVRVHEARPDGAKPANHKQVASARSLTHFNLLPRIHRIVITPPAAPCIVRK